MGASYQAVIFRVFCDKGGAETWQGQELDSSVPCVCVVPVRCAKYTLRESSFEIDLRFLSLLQSMCEAAQDNNCFWSSTTLLDLPQSIVQ